MLQRDFPQKLLLMMLQNDKKIGHRCCVQHIFARAALHAGGGKDADVGTPTGQNQKLIFLILLQGREGVRLHR